LTIGNVFDEGDISDILLLQLAEMMECEAKPSDISHMDLLYAQIDDITLSEVCQAMRDSNISTPCPLNQLQILNNTVNIT
jgi:hypothetical protein